jgi:subtilisin family serine protease
VYPCAFPQANLLCVTALDQQYALAAFSNYGATSVDVGAPGTNILSSVVLQTTRIPEGFDSGGWPRVDKTFTLPAGKNATLKFSLRYDLPPGDSLTVHYRVGAGDPFASGVLLQSFAGTTIGAVGPFVYDISACAGGPCTIGFRLSSDAASGAQSVVITSFQIDVTGSSNVAYRVLNGTSMAAPQASGLAALLRAYNPQYTYADVFNAMSGAGRPVASLAGKTTSGRALDAMSSLAHINPPTGLAATFP